MDNQGAEKSGLISKIRDSTRSDLSARKLTVANYIRMGEMDPGICPGLSISADLILKNEGPSGEERPKVAMREWKFWVSVCTQYQIVGHPHGQPRTSWNTSKSGFCMDCLLRDAVTQNGRNGLSIILGQMSVQCDLRPKIPMMANNGWFRSQKISYLLEIIWGQSVSWFYPPCSLITCCCTHTNVCCL